VPDIFDEIEEDLRADRTRRLAKRWGGAAIGVALLALAAAGGWQAWRWVAQGFGTLAQAAPDGYRTLARLRAAALKAETGDTPAALALWDELARDSAAEALYRDLAALLYVGHGLETVDAAQLAARIGPLTQPGNAWQAPAREMAALVAIRRGDTAEARQQLQALAADTAATPGLRERAQRLAAGLGS